MANGLFYASDVQINADGIAGQLAGLFDKDLRTGNGSRLSQIRFVHGREEDIDHLDLNFKGKRNRIGFLGARKQAVSCCDLHLRAESLTDKLKDVANAFPDSARAVSAAIRTYKVKCFKESIFPHQSDVHSFGDTVKQAYVLTLPGKDDEERYNMALMTFYAHLVDDFIDNMDDICETVGELKDYKNLNLGLEKIDVLTDWMLENLPPEDREQGMRTVTGVIYGSLIQHTKTKEEQEKYAQMYKNFVIEPVKGTPLGEEIERLHPMQVWATTHVDLASWFALEKGNNEKALPILYNLLYAPMLYCHDRVEEKKGEKMKIRYGQEICRKGYVADEYLIELLDVFDRNVNNFEDLRRKQRLIQVKTVYKMFKPVLPEALKQKYEQSLSRLEQTSLS